MAIGIGTHAFAESRYSPAVFLEGEDSFVNKITFPESDQDVLATILCDAIVTNTGRFRNSNCYYDKSLSIRDYKTAVDRVTETKKVFFKPASIDGNHKRVALKFSVIFQKKDNEKKIWTFLNHGVEIAKYGNDYISAQLHKTGNLRTYSRCYAGNSFWMASTIGVDGTPGNIKAIKSDAPALCKEVIQEIFNEFRFIPATKNGQSVLSRSLSYIQLTYRGSTGGINLDQRTKNQSPNVDSDDIIATFNGLDFL